MYPEEDACGPWGEGECQLTQCGPLAGALGEGGVMESVFSVPFCAHCLCHLLELSELCWQRDAHHRTILGRHEPS